MRWFVSGMLLVLSVLALPPPVRAQLEVPSGPRQKWPALDLEGGIAYGASGVAWTSFGRASAGLHLIDRQRVATFSAGFHMVGTDHKAFGAWAELASIGSGLGAGVGATLSTRGDPGVSVGVGASLLRLEGLFVFGEHPGRAVLACLRVPLGLIAYGLWGERR